MTLPASGPLSLSDIQTEFGGTNPIALGEYYAGGGLVPAGTSGTYGAVPSSGQISVQNFYGTTAYTPIYVEELFQTWLYNGNGGAQTITNGIDLSGNGGLVWVKSRSNSYDHALYDTARGINNELYSNATGQAYTGGGTLTAFNSNGFTLGNNSTGNFTNNTDVSWTFREQPKFFDIVSYTGNGVNDRAISHNLGSTPGFIIIKRTNSPLSWFCYHTSLGVGKYITLNQTAASVANVYAFPAVSSTTFTPVSDPNQIGLNTDGDSYIAYLFAHNAGGFGATGTDNVISCGSFTASGGNATIDLGYEPQWVMFKSSSTASSGNWYMVDIMRGWIANDPGNNSNRNLYANLTDAEDGGAPVALNSTGFTFSSSFGPWASATFIYVAIRRGPMKVPTLGTTVYGAVSRSGTGSAASITSLSFPPDLLVDKARTAGYEPSWWDRLRGPNKVVLSSKTNGQTATSDSLNAFGQTGVSIGADGGGYLNNPGATYINWFFRRAPSFFDEAYYIGANQFTGASGFAAQSVTHNLTVAPEFMIVKSLSAGGSWFCYFASNGNSSDIFLNDTVAKRTGVVTWNQFTPTSTTFQVNAAAGINSTGSTYVAWLFATTAGVSKVGTYTGTGALQTVNCGFTTGVRWVMIKRSDSTGAWYVWDSTRGISSGNDPYLLMNADNTEVTSTNYVDTTSVGFQVTAAAPADLNANGGTYLFLAIA